MRKRFANALLWFSVLRDKAENEITNYIKEQAKTCPSEETTEKDDNEIRPGRRCPSETMTVPQDSSSTPEDSTHESVESDNISSDGTEDDTPPSASEDAPEEETKGRASHYLRSRCAACFGNIVPEKG